MKRHTIRRRLFLLFFIMSAIPVGILMIVIPLYMKEYENRQIKKYMTSLSDSYSKTLNIYFDELDRVSLLAQIDNDVMTALKLVNQTDYDQMSDRIKVATNRALNSEFTFYLQMSREDITNVILIPITQKNVYISSKSGNLESKDHYDYSRQEWYTRAIEANGKAVFCGPHRQDYIENGNHDSVFTVSRAVIDTENQKILGVVCACADSTILNELVREIKKVDKDSLIAVLDSKNQYIYGSSRLKDIDFNEILEQGDDVVQIQDEKYMMVKVTTANSWSLLSLVSDRVLVSKIIFYFRFGFFLAAVSFVLMAAVYSWYSKKITKPFMEIIRVIKEVQKNNLKAKCAIETNDEIADIEYELNKMVCRLDELVTNEYQAKLNQKNAEYEALQAKVNPHFLYNTLATFIGLNRMGERDKLEKAVFALRDLMRDILSEKTVVSIEEEIDLIKKYLELQKLRFADKFSIKISVDPVAAHYKIPQHLLQPLVENAVIHGIEEANHTCNLSILVSRVETNGETWVIIRISDDGIGFEVEKTKFNSRIGIQNVENRLKIYFPTADFQICTQLGKGTDVVIKINEREMKNEDNPGR